MLICRRNGSAKGNSFPGSVHPAASANSQTQRALAKCPIWYLGNCCLRPATAKRHRGDLREWKLFVDGRDYRVGIFSLPILPSSMCIPAPWQSLLFVGYHTWYVPPGHHSQSFLIKTPVSRLHKNPTPTCCPRR